MRELVQEHARSGVSPNAFAAAAGVPYTTLAWWRAQLRGDADAVLVPVVVAKDEFAGIEIATSEGSNRRRCPRAKATGLTSRGPPARSVPAIGTSPTRRSDPIRARHPPDATPPELPRVAYHSRFLRQMRHMRQAVVVSPCPTTTGACFGSKRPEVQILSPRPQVTTHARVTTARFRPPVAPDGRIRAQLGWSCVVARPRA